MPLFKKRACCRITSRPQLAFCRRAVVEAQAHAASGMFLRAVGSYAGCTLAWFLLKIAVKEAPKYATAKNSAPKKARRYFDFDATK